MKVSNTVIENVIFFYYTSREQERNVCIFQDPVTRGVNGVGWALMSDEQSIQKALDFYDSGEVGVALK